MPDLTHQSSDLVLVVKLDHHEAELFIYRPSRRLLEDYHRLEPHDPRGHRRHLEHRSQTRLPGERAPEDIRYYTVIEKYIAEARSALVLGSGTGTSSASDVLQKHLATHAKAALKNAVFKKVDLSALTRARIVEFAAELYPSHPSETLS